MNQPLLTIGMAHYDDFAGLFPTIQSLRLNNMDLMKDVEFVVVNNNPEDDKTSQAIIGLLNSTVECRPATYVALPGNKGTSISRDNIFRHAKGKYVLVMDCHVELWPGGLRKLMDHYAADPESRDILTGPLLYDSLRNVSTHFDDAWDDAMWGKWGQAWKCQCGPEGVEFSVIQRDGFTQPIKLALGQQPVHQCRACRKQVPVGVDWAGHETPYVNAGFFPLGLNDGPAFEIPGQGLGLFSCRRDAWVGFNPNAVGFGGEELYVHEKFRRAGGRALCLPGLKWNHRFYRTGGAKYPNTNYWKARNYVLEFNELGWDLEPIRKHFVEEPVKRLLPEIVTHLSPEAWEALVEDPIGNTTDPTTRILAIKAASGLMPHLATIDQLFDEIRVIPRDLNEHMEVLRALATQVDGSVVELTGRRESTIALLAGRPKTVISFSTEVDAHCYKAANLVNRTTRFIPTPYVMGDIVPELPENDLLFIDTFHNFAQLTKELEAYTPRCRRYIVLHDTEVYGPRGDDAGLGLVQAIAEFCDTHPQWAVIDHTKLQYGLTILSCQLDDRPEKPVEGFNVPHGPGTELKRILQKLGIHPSPDCSCNSKAAQMDVWGVEGCESPDKFPVIVEWLKAGTWNGLDLASAVARSFFTGIAWQLNPLSPFESLVRLCIKRAKESEFKRLMAKSEVKS